MFAALTTAAPQISLLELRALAPDLDLELPLAVLLQTLLFLSLAALLPWDRVRYMGRSCLVITIGIAFRPVRVRGRGVP